MTCECPIVDYQVGDSCVMVADWDVLGLSVCTIMSHLQDNGTYIVKRGISLREVHPEDLAPDVGSARLCIVTKLQKKTQRLHQAIAEIEELISTFL